MKYLVTEIKGIFDANNGQKRVSFTVENYPHQVSGFFTELPKVGEEIEGDIVQKAGTTKTGVPTTYHNFFPPKTSAPRQAAQPSQALNYMSRNIDATLQGVQVLTASLNRLVERLETKGVLDQDTRDSVLQKPYPAANGATAFDDIDESQIPF